MATKSVHVVPHEGAWGVRVEDSPRLVSTHRTQAAATKAGRALAKRNSVELFIHGADGRIVDRDSFGGDSPRRKDTIH